MRCRKIEWEQVRNFWLSAADLQGLLDLAGRRGRESGEPGHGGARLAGASHAAGAPHDAQPRRRRGKGAEEGSPGRSHCGVLNLWCNRHAAAAACCLRSSRIEKTTCCSPRSSSGAATAPSSTRPARPTPPMATV